MKEKFTIKQIRKMKMTDEEKLKVWDGVLRRVTDYPPGEYPFEGKPSTWDGVLRRKSDYPDGNVPEELLKTKVRGKDRGNKDKDNSAQ
jgi:hypothetical protein